VPWAEFEEGNVDMCPDGYVMYTYLQIPAILMLEDVRGSGFWPIISQYVLGDVWKGRGSPEISPPLMKHQFWIGLSLWTKLGIGPIGPRPTGESSYSRLTNSHTLGVNSVVSRDDPRPLRKTALCWMLLASMCFFGFLAVACLLLLHSGNKY